MQMIMIDRLVFHRRGDPQNEYRELLLCKDQEHWFAVYQIIGFAHSADFYHREELGFGTEREMRKLLVETAAELYQEGFFFCEEGARQYF